MKAFVRSVFIIAYLAGSLAISGVASAQIFGSDPGGGTHPGLGTGQAQPVSFIECIKNGNCGVEHLFDLSNNIIRWLVGAAGALALLMYVIGGVWMILSGGKSNRIEKGKDILIGTTVALVFILGSWILVSFVLQALGTKPEYLIAPQTCGGTTCSATQTCDKNTCKDLCEVTKANEPQYEWQCQPISDCANIQIQDCGNVSYCKPSQCSAPNLVCCYKP